MVELIGAAVSWNNGSSKFSVKSQSSGVTHILETTWTTEKEIIRIVYHDRSPNLTLTKVSAEVSIKGIDSNGRFN